jgi:hypothetical protein
VEVHNSTLRQVLLGDWSKECEMGGACSTHKIMRNACKILVGKSKERPWRRWEYNNNFDLKGIDCENLDWIHPARSGGLLWIW